jgi:hypothetical protein
MNFNMIRHVFFENVKRMLADKWIIKNFREIDQVVHYNLFLLGEAWTKTKSNASRPDLAKEEVVTAFTATCLTVIIVLTSNYNF